MKIQQKNRGIMIALVVFALVATVAVTMIAGPKAGKDISTFFRKALAK